MRNLTMWSFRNKAAVWIVTVMALIIGTASYLMMPMEFLPEADNPMVTITTIGPGYDARTMESQVTKPLEKAVDNIKGKSNTFSTSGDGYSKIDLFFDRKDMKEAKAEVQAAIDQVRMPERVAKPFVVQFNTAMIPISWMTISFDNGLTPENMTFAENKLVAELQKIDGIGHISFYGKASPNIAISPDSEKLAQHGIPFQSLLSVLDGREITAAIGSQTISQTTANLKVAAEIHDLETLRKLPVGPGVALGDVAQIQTDSAQESVSRVNGKEALLLQISKAADANAVAVGEQVKKTVEQLNRDYPQAQVQILGSTSEQIVHSVESMMQEVLLGALFATIVIMLFLRNIKATLITIVSIPLSMATTLFLLDLSGITLNVITLGGVAVAVGRLVDDSIVVIENIYRRLQKETFSPALIIDATKEVASAITSSTLTTVAVFLPMGLLRGSLQAFLLPFALTVTYALLSSLVVALAVVPLLGSALLKNTTMKERPATTRFASFLNWNLSHKWVPLAIAAALFFGSVGGYAAMPKGAIDSSNASALSVTLEYPTDTPPDQVLAEGKKLEAYLVEQDEQNWVSMSYGNSADAAREGQVLPPTLVSFMIEVKKGADAEQLIKKVQNQRKNFPGAELNAGKLDFATNASATEIYVDITGENLQMLGEAADKVMKMIQPVDGVLKVKSNQEQIKQVYTFQVDPKAANAKEFAMQLNGMLNPIPLGSLRLGDHESAVYLEPIIHPQSEDDLAKLTVMTNSGPLPVSSVAKLVKTEEPSLYYRKDGSNYVRVTATVEPSQLSIVGDEISSLAKKLSLPDGIELHVGGASADQAKDFADLGMIAVISIFIVYLIMVITFKTLRAPLAIMFSLPLAAIGAVIALLATGIAPDFTAMFGALMLIGIVVTNAIVLVDRVRHNEQTMPIRKALLEAADTRMRPIFMTSIATICAMLPLVLGTAEEGSIVSQSMAVVVIGGLIAATMLTLIIVPCVYELLHFRKAKKQRLQTAD